MEYFEQSDPEGLRVPCLITADTKLPYDPNSFLVYPESEGWRLHHDYRLELHGSQGAPRQDLAAFLQSWLFFGLIGATIQVDGRPVLREDKLRDGEFLVTNNLAAAFREWVDWERWHPEGQQVRQVEVGYILSTARQVVRRNCGLDIVTKSVSYSASIGHPQYVPDQLALLLMVVGETLSTILVGIMEDAIARTALLNAGLGDGWGPPRWVLAQMEKEGWCPRDVRLIHDQLGAHATPLLSAYITSVKSAPAVLRHQGCTEDVCRLKDYQRHGGLRGQNCLPNCKSAWDGSCKLAGPDMDSVMEILGSSSYNSEEKTWSCFPVLRFRPKIPDEPESIDLEVCRIETNSLPPEDFATISHVWNGCWAHPDENNKMPLCRLRLLKYLIRHSNHGQDMYFWMDSLIMPGPDYGDKEMRRQFRKVAIAQIFQIFQKAKYTIVLDQTLANSPKGDPPELTAKACLSHAWLGRLRRLLESHLKTEPSNEGSILDSQETRYQIYRLMSAPVNTLNWVQSGDFSANSAIIQASTLKTRKRTTVIANAWKAFRWEMTSPIAKADEMLALASLLDIDSRQIQHETTTLPLVTSTTHSQRRMASFWTKIDTKFPGSIPPYLIFLPGEKPGSNYFPGFGWVPTVGAIIDEMERSEFLMARQDDTDLIPNEGLLVTFPGILLPLLSEYLRRQILGMNGSNAFHLPLKVKGMCEWICVSSTSPGRDTEFLSEVAQRQSELAIILPSEKIPHNSPGVALLVEIYEECITNRAENPSKSPGVLYKCQIVRRILVRYELTSAIFDGGQIFQRPSNVPRSEIVNHFRLPSRSDGPRDPKGAICFGEWTSCEQEWTVDGFQPKRPIVFPNSAPQSRPDTSEGTAKPNTSNPGKQQDVDDQIHNKLETIVKSQIPFSPLRQAWSYWIQVAGGGTNLPPVKEKSQTPDPGLRLIDVSLLETSPTKESWDLRRVMMSVEEVVKISFPTSSSQSTSLLSGSKAQVASTWNALEGYALSPSFADAADVTLQSITTFIGTYPEVMGAISRSPKKSVSESLAKSIHYYGVLLWHLAYEAWESELALLVGNNAQQICDGILDQIHGQTPVNVTLETDFTAQSQTEAHIKQFLVRGGAFLDLLYSVEYIVSERNLLLVVHIQDEAAVQDYMLATTHNTKEAEQSGVSPMDVATSRASSTSVMGFSEAAKLKSLRIIQKIQSVWPLKSWPLKSYHATVVAIAQAALTGPFGSGTEFARFPEDDDNFWDVVTKVSAFLPAIPEYASHFRTAANLVYSWEVLDLLSIIQSSKLHANPEPSENSQLWSPLRIFSELAATVTITGCSNTFELDTCGGLLQKYWGDVGLDALRLIAAGAFLCITSRKACHDQTRALSTVELNAYIINTLQSQHSSMNTQQQHEEKSAEEMVLHELFGERLVPIISNMTKKPILTLSKTCKKALIFRDTSDYAFEVGLRNVALKEALAWACAALRPNSPGKLGLTKNSTRRSQGSFHSLKESGRFGSLSLLMWTLNPMEDMSHEDLGSPHCWTALFAPGLVVPHKADRRWGKGLRMSFEMMVHLSASQACIWIDDEPWTKQAVFGGEGEPNRKIRSGGYILAGYRTALVPISRSPDGTGIQWHLEKPEDPSAIMDHTSLKSVKGDWLKIQDVSEFHGRVCYIGWYDKAEVLLGTDKLENIPEWSGAETQHRSLHAASRNFNATIGVGSAVLSPLSAQLTLGTTYNFFSNVQTYDPSKDYNDAIRKEHGKTALVVDCTKKQAYLVPKLSLLLHLCRVESLRSRLDLGTNVQTSPTLPAAVPSDNGSRAALQVLKENENAIFLGSENTADRTTLRELFIQVHHELIKAAGHRESPTRVALFGSKVFATELRGVLERPDRGTPLSVIQDPRILAWVRLAALADAVCICSNLGTAIRPVEVGNTPNCECYELPHDRYFLAAHMRCLQDILQRQCCAISELNLRGELDFGEGYIMRLSGRRLWTQGRHQKHRKFWENRAEVVQSIHKEDGVDGTIRKLLGTDGKAGQRAGEDPTLTGVMVFGIRC